VNIFGGGVLANCRRVVPNGDELLVFTKDTLYSWDAGLAKWVARGTHLAIKVTEQSRFVTTGDQIDGDRAELAGTVVIAWTENVTTYVAAADKATGAVLMAPTAIAGGALRPRLVALTTKILLFFHDNITSLLVYALDPANPAAALGGASTTVLGGGASNFYYDAVGNPAKDAAIVGIRRQVTTSYEVVKVTEALARTNVTKARTCDGPIAVSVSPDGLRVQVVRANGTNIQGDLLNAATLADVFVAQAIGTVAAVPVNQIAACHRSVQNGGQYRCYAFWSSEETATEAGFSFKSNWADTNNTLGVQATLMLRTGVASRAFDYDGSVYVWGAFAGESGATGMGQPLGLRAQLQNTYFLFRDDGTFHAKAAFAQAGGFSPSIGHLPNVAGVGTTYAWCGAVRRIIELGGNHSGFSARAPRDITFTFDSNEARRCARLGETLYIAGGEVLQYDGAGLVEVGFHTYPWFFATAQIGGGALPAGKYSYKVTARWLNAKGEQERSTTASGEQEDVVLNNKVVISIASIHHTHKQGARANPSLEVWRTKVAPGLDSPFYLDTSRDPNALAGDNRYIANAPLSSFATTGNDNMLDGVLETKEEDPEVGTVLVNMAPPAASIIIASDERLFLAGVAGDPRRVWYSKLRGEGEVAAFHKALTFDVPAAGGDITALALLDGVVPVVFCESATYAFPGVGFANDRSGENYGPVRICSTDVGAVSHEATALTPAGVVFKSSKGRYLLGRDLSVTYIGGPVSDFDGDTELAVHVLESKHQIRWLTGSRMLVHDYREGVNQWSEWTVADGLHACIWQGTHVYLAAAGPKIEQAAYAGLTYGLDVETAWVKPNDTQGKGRVRLIEVLGEFRSACALRVRLARDYDDAYFYDKTWTVTPTAVGGPLQLEVSPSIQQVEALKVRLTAVKGGTQAQLDTVADLVPQQLDGTVGAWAARLTAIPKGAAGNAVTISIGVGDSGAAPWSMELRDGQKWDGGTLLWTPLANNIGIKLLGKGDGTSSPTVAHVEALIDAYSRLASVSVHDATPGRVVDVPGLSGITLTGPLAGGVDSDNNTAPTGEAVKLSALAFDVVPLPGTQPAPTSGAEGIAT
jgi:hypothetical protein